MRKRVNIVTSCSERKRSVQQSPILLRDVPAGTIEQRLMRWRELLERAKVRCPARDLYVGEHWSIARDITKQAEALKIEADLWVCSAGYGFIHADTSITPYGATFTRGHPDSVAKPGRYGDVPDSSVSKAWWTASIRRNETHGLAALAAQDPQTPLLVAVSANYLTAISDDLREAAGRLRTPDLLIVIAAGTEHPPAGLGDNLMPTGAEFSGSLGGTLGSLNIRLALQALRWATRGGFGAKYLRGRFRRRQSEIPVFTRPNRDALDDERVAVFIKRHLRQASSHTAMLRLLRDSGFACEQSRFREIYVATVASESESANRKEPGR